MSAQKNPLEPGFALPMPPAGGVCRSLTCCGPLEPVVVSSDVPAPIRTPLLTAPGVVDEVTVSLPWARAGGGARASGTATQAPKATIKHRLNLRIETLLQPEGQNAEPGGGFIITPPGRWDSS